jgi:hypothetical protein
MPTYYGIVMNRNVVKANGYPRRDFLAAQLLESVDSALMNVKPLPKGSLMSCVNKHI